MLLFLVTISAPTLKSMSNGLPQLVRELLGFVVAVKRRLILVSLLVGVQRITAVVLGKLILVLPVETTLVVPATMELIIVAALHHQHQRHHHHQHQE